MAKVEFGKLNPPNEVRAAIEWMAHEFPPDVRIRFRHDSARPALFEVEIESPEVGRGSGLFENGDFEGAMRYLDDLRAVLLSPQT